VTGGTSTRRAGLGTSRRRRGPAVLPAGAINVEGDAHRGGHTDAAPVYPAVLDELIPSAWHHVEQYANNPIEADHSRLEHRLRPMRGLQTDRTAQVIIAGHAFMQNLRNGHYELAVDATLAQPVATAFSELALAI
jgi:hypothetical protein